jgi:hypothetical protein
MRAPCSFLPTFLYLKVIALEDVASKPWQAFSSGLLAALAPNVFGNVGRK